MRNALFLALLQLAGCASPSRLFGDRRLDVLPDGFHARSFRFSRDGHVAAYVLLGAPEQDRVVVRRTAGPPLALIC